MYFFVTIVKRLPKQLPLTTDCNASINSKREHPLWGTGQIPAPRAGRFCENTPPSKKPGQNPTLGENFVPFSIQ